VPVYTSVISTPVILVIPPVEASLKLISPLFSFIAPVSLVMTTWKISSSIIVVVVIYSNGLILASDHVTETIPTIIVSSPSANRSSIPVRTILIPVSPAKIVKNTLPV